MSKRMVRGSVLVMMVVFAWSIAPAQQGTAQEQPLAVRYAGQFERMEKGMDVDAHADVPGIVESTIYNLVQCKSVFPDKEFARHIEWLDKTAARQKDARLIYKATLASMYLRYGSPVTDNSVFDPYDHEKAFKTIAAQLASHLLASTR